MVYAQTACFYLMKTAVAAGMFCLIISTAGTVSKEIFRIILAGTIACLILPILLKYVMTAALLIIAWRLAKSTKTKAMAIADTADEALWNNRYVTRLQTHHRIKKLQKARQRRRQRQLNKEIRTIKRLNP